MYAALFALGAVVVVVGLVVAVDAWNAAPRAVPAPPRAPRPKRAPPGRRVARRKRPPRRLERDEFPSIEEMDTHPDGHDTRVRHDTPTVLMEEEGWGPEVEAIVARMDGTG